MTSLYTFQKRLTSQNPLHIILWKIDLSPLKSGHKKTSGGIWGLSEKKQRLLKRWSEKTFIRQSLCLATCNNKWRAGLFRVTPPKPTLSSLRKAISSQFSPDICGKWCNFYAFKCFISFSSCPRALLKSIQKCLPPPNNRTISVSIWSFF